jgi:hypothetical protein
MAHFDFFDACESAKGVPQFVDHIKGGPGQGLVHHKGLSFEKSLGTGKRQFMWGVLGHDAKVFGS